MSFQLKVVLQLEEPHTFISDVTYEPVLFPLSKKIKEEEKMVLIIYFFIP